MSTHNRTSQHGTKYVSTHNRTTQHGTKDVSTHNRATQHGTKDVSTLVLLYLESRKCRYRSIIFVCFYLYVPVVNLIDYSDIDKMMDINN